MMNIIKKQALVLMAFAAVQGIQAQTGIEVPYIQNLESYQDFFTMKIVDANNDGNTFEYWSYKNVAQYMPNNNNADDWLITPALHLKPGYRYVVKATASNNYQGSTDVMEVGYCADGTEVSGMTIFRSATNITNRDEQDISDIITVKTDGDYRIGWHVITPKKGGSLLIGKISVTAIAGVDAPGEVTELTATPGAEGAHYADISFKTPAKSATDKDITDLTKVEVYRGETLVKEFGQQKAATLLTWRDNEAPRGFNTYTVKAYNEAGEGMPAMVETYVGEDTAKQVKDIYLTDNDNSLTLSWKAPDETGLNGYYVNTKGLKYSVYDADGTRVAHDLTTTSWTREGVDQNVEQYVQQYSVTATNEAGENERTYCNGVVIGRPYTVPFKESFPNMNTENAFWWTDRSGKSNWWPDRLFAQDGDHGSTSFQAEAEGDNASVNTGKITLIGTNNPRLSFYYYCTPGENIILKAWVENMTEATDTVLNVDVRKLTGEAGWHRVSAPLTQYKDGRYITVHFNATGLDKEAKVAVDNIMVSEVYDYDLQTEISAPRKAVVSGKCPVKAIVTNVGNKTAKKFKVVLHAGEFTAEQEGKDLAADESRTFTFDYVPAPSEASLVNAYAETVFAYDLDNDNDKSASVEINVSQSGLAKPENVTAVASGADAVIGWTAPANTARKIEEDFEGYEPWIKEGIGEWITIDCDKAPTYQDMHGDFPGEREPMAFIVFNPTDKSDFAKFDDIYKPHSGEQYLACFSAYSAPKKCNDDWLISPELSGDAQTAQFYAHSMNYYLKESFEIAYSEGGTEPEDFTVLQTVTGADSDWTLYFAELPAGAKRLAVHCITRESSCALAVDDFSFMGRKCTVTGYNIYRDGKLAGTADATATAFTDNSVEAGAHSYKVTALYAEGESGFSDVADVTTAISSATAEVAEGKAQFFDLAGQRRQQMQNGVNIIRMQNGKVIKVIKK